MQLNPNFCVTSEEEKYLQKAAKELIEYWLINKQKLKFSWEGKIYIESTPQLLRDLAARSTDANYKMNPFRELVFELIYSDPELQAAFFAFLRRANYRKNKEVNLDLNLGLNFFGIRL